MLYLDAFDKATQSVNSRLSKTHQDAMEKNADACNYFRSSVQNQPHKSCLHCAYLDTQVYSCSKLNKTVIPYKWV